MKGVSVAALGLLASCGALAQPWRPGGDLAPDHAILTERTATLVRTAQMVAAPHVLSYAWSPTGGQMLVWVQDSPRKGDLWTALNPPPARPAPPPGIQRAKPGMSLLRWTRGAQRATEVWAAQSESEPPRPDWMGRSGVALLAFYETRPAPPVPAGREAPAPDAFLRVVRVDAANGRAETILLTPETPVQSITVSVSPVQPFAVLTTVEHIRQRVPRADGTLAERTVRYRITLSRVDASGPVQRLATFEQTERWSGIEWLADGTAATHVPLPAAQRSASPDGARWRRIDARTGALIDLPGSPERWSPAQNAPLRVVRTQAGVGPNGGDPPVPVLWLEAAGPAAPGDHPTRALLAAEASRGSVAPDASAVAYESRGALWVSALQTAPRAEYDVAWRKAVRAQALSNAKQIGLSALMYANDYDEIFPPATDVANLLVPYSKNPDLFRGFVYLLDGSKVADIDSPAETPMGYVSAPGGRAVIYSDGHAKWLDDEHGDLPRRRRWSVSSGPPHRTARRAAPIAPGDAPPPADMQRSAGTHRPPGSTDRAG